MSTLLNADETALRLGVSVGTLGVWRSEKRYSLRYVKVGRCVRYRVEDIEQFLESRTMPGVSQLSGSSRRGERRRPASSAA